MITIDILDPPVTKTTPFGSITLTHRAWGFTIQAWSSPPMRSYSVLGVLENESFTVYPGSEDYATFSMADFLALSADPEVGPHVTATVEAIKAAHLQIVSATSPPVQSPAVRTIDHAQISPKARPAKRRTRR